MHKNFNQNQLFQRQILFMNKHHQLNLASFFQELFDAQSSIDLLKKQLLKTNNYSPELIFDKIAEQKQYITVNQLEKYLSTKIKPNEKQLNDIFCKFDWSRKGVISRNDFLNEIYPRGHKNKNPIANNGVLSVEVQALFLQLMRQYITRFRVLQVARKQIAEIFPYDAFDHIAIQKRGTIGQQELKIFLNKNDIDITPQQLSFLMYGLRRRIYTHINLEVFSQNLNPLQFGMYQTYLQNIQHEQSENYLRRSRHEDEQMKRSRIDNHKLANQQRKIQRRKIADLQKQKEISEELRNLQLKNAQQNERRHRKSLLQTQKRIRWGLENQNATLYEQQRLNQIQKQRLLQIQAKNRLQETKNLHLNEDLYANNLQLDKSRKKLEYERELVLEQEIKNDLKKQRLIRQAQIQEQSLALERELLRRKKYEQDVLKQRENLRRSQQLQRIRLQQQQFRLLQREKYERLEYQQRLLNEQRFLQRQKLLQNKYVPEIDVYKYRHIQEEKPSYKRYGEQFQNTRYQDNIIDKRSRNRQDELNFIANRSRKTQQNINSIRASKNAPTTGYTVPTFGRIGQGAKTPLKQYQLDKTRTDLQSKKKKLEQEAIREKSKQGYNSGSNYKDRQLKRSYFM